VSSQERIVVIGVGNPERGDDAVGRVVARELRDRVPAQVAVLEQNGDAASLAQTLGEVDCAIVVDAVSTGAPPGTIHRFDSESVALAPGAGPSSTHGLGVAEAVELSRALGGLPQLLVVVGIEAGEFERGAPLSSDVSLSVGAATEAVLSELERVIIPATR